MVDIKLYTVAQLREWLKHNNAAEGLSERIIAPSRAWAIIHNPYVKDEDPVVATIFVNEENAAYVTAFPELVDDKRYWWFSALWCNPKYQGNGYGLIVVGSLAEVYGPEFCLDKWGATETVEIFTYLGLQTTYTSRYSLGVSINTSSVRGRLVHLLRSTQINLNRSIKRYTKEHYNLRYIPFIDDATYSFIKAHSNAYYFQHSHDFLDWVLRYPFSISAPLIERVDTKMPFSSAEKLQTHIYAVQVLDGHKLIGFYILKQNTNILQVLYLYYDNLHERQVFASIRDHVRTMHITRCETEHKELADYLHSQVYFPKYRVEDISFSAPSQMILSQGLNFQLGDGDGFV